MSVATDAGFAYVTTNGSSTISGYRVLADGALELIDMLGVTTLTGSNPVDLAITPDNSFLYAVNAGAGTISGFLIDRSTER